MTFSTPLKCIEMHIYSTVKSSITPKESDWAWGIGIPRVKMTQLGLSGDWGNNKTKTWRSSWSMIFSDWSCQYKYEHYYFSEDRIFVYCFGSLFIVQVCLISWAVSEHICPPIISPKHTTEWLCEGGNPGQSWLIWDCKINKETRSSWSRKSWRDKINEGSQIGPNVHTLILGSHECAWHCILVPWHPQLQSHCCWATACSTGSEQALLLKYVYFILAVERNHTLALAPPPCHHPW